MDKKEQRKKELETMILKLYKNIPRLKEGYALPPGWRFREEFSSLNKEEQELLKEVLNELIENGIITADLKITKKGIKKVTYELKL